MQQLANCICLSGIKDFEISLSYLILDINNVLFVGLFGTSAEILK